MVDVECPVSGFSESFIGLNLRKTTDVRGGSVDVKPASTHDWNSYAYGGVGGSPTVLLDGNDNRISALVRNIGGGTALYLCLGSVANTSTSMWLDEGDAYEINQTNLFKGTVWGVSPGTVIARAMEF